MAITEVTRYQAADGSLHDTRAKAEAYESRCALVDVLTRELDISRAHAQDIAEAIHDFFDLTPKPET